MDRGIVSPDTSIWDFYQQSCVGVQGTLKATRYRVWFDQNAFTSDTLQTLTCVERNARCCYPGVPVLLHCCHY